MEDDAIEDAKVGGDGAMGGRGRTERRRSPAIALLAWLALAACEETNPLATDTEARRSVECSIPEELIFSGAPKDGIPALTDPVMVQPGGPGLSYLEDDDRVVGIELNGAAYAIPLNILWYHEIVNLTVGDRHIAVTHCPLTGSSLVFDRSVIDDAELGVSGLLYLNNLMMYDRTTTESLWPQMSRAARCGPKDGEALEVLPVLELRWDAWRELNPGTRVVSGETGYQRDYRIYPYGTYASLHNAQTLYPMPTLDDRRPPKEPVLGIPEGAGGIVFPFGELDEGGPVSVAHFQNGPRTGVVFWDAGAVTAMAYTAQLDGRTLTFSVRSGQIVDEETGSVWRVTGRAVAGPLINRRLTPIADAYLSYWFAWAAFQPETRIWERS